MVNSAEFLRQVMAGWYAQAFFLLCYFTSLACASSTPIVLDGPLMMEVSSKGHSLMPVDLDSDNRKDLMLFDNGSSRILLYYQRSKDELRKAAQIRVDRTRWEPILENAPFLKESIKVPDFLYAVNGCDFDGDGLTDIIYTGKTSGIGIIFQTALGKWSKPLTYDKYLPISSPTAITCEDLNGDGKVDILAMMQGHLLLLYNSGKRLIPKMVVLAVSANGADRVLLHDINQDGKKDLLIIASREKNRHLYLRLQTTGGFGPEMSVDQKFGSSAVLVEAVDGNCVMTAIEEGNTHLSEYQLKFDTLDLSLDRQFQPMIYHPSVERKSKLTSVSGDFSGRGLFEVAVADPIGSQLFLYSDLSERLSTNIQGTATLGGIQSLAKMRLKGADRDSLVVCSLEEKMVGVTTLGDDGRFAFPSFLSVSGEPILVQSLDLKKDNDPEIIVALRDGRRLNLEVFSKAGGTWSSKILRFGSIQRTPTALIAGDFNCDGLDDLLMTIPRESARVFFQQKDGGLLEDEANKVIYGSQFDDLTENIIGFGDFDGKGKRELLICRNGYIRAFAYNEKNELSIVGQANSRHPTEELVAPFLVDLDKDGTKELTAYVPKTGELLVFKVTSAANYIYSFSIKIGSIDLKSIQFTPFSNNQALFLSGERQFWVMPFTDRQWLTREQSRYDNQLKGARYGLMGKADLNNDKKPELIVIDQNSGVVNILSRNSSAEQPWDGTLHFPVFEKKAGRQKAVLSEPREMVVADVTNDGLVDLILLCHNRILVYPQERTVK
ncbi:hypothetical protein BVY04_01215 [bacterium M21]|nr:hypothetical protein BVY04_01215 [bacterium M21]